jgi:hypothetical protein
MLLSTFNKDFMIIVVKANNKLKTMELMYLLIMTSFGAYRQYA